MLAVVKKRLKMQSKFFIDKGKSLSVMTAAETQSCLGGQDLQVPPLMYTSHSDQHPHVAREA